MKYKVLSLLSIICFAAYPTLSKYVLQQNGPLVVIFATQLISAIALLFIFGFIPEIKKIWQFRHQDPYLIVIALFSGAVAPACNLYGLQHSSVINLVLINTIQTPIAVFLSLLLLKEKVDWRYVLGLLCMMFGITIYSTQCFQTTFQFSWNDLFFVAAAVIFAVSDVLYKKHINHISHEVVLIIRNSFGSIFVFIIMMFLSLETHVSISFDNQSLIGMGLIVLVPIITAQALWYTSLEKIDNTEAALYSSLYAVFAAIIAFISLGETIVWYQILGGLIMVLGLMLSHLNPEKWRFHMPHLKLIHFKNH